MFRFIPHCAKRGCTHVHSNECAGGEYLTPTQRRTKEIHLLRKQLKWVAFDSAFQWVIQFRQVNYFFTVSLILSDAVQWYRVRMHMVANVWLIVTFFMANCYYCHPKKVMKFTEADGKNSLFACNRGDIHYLQISKRAFLGEKSMLT